MKVTSINSFHRGFFKRPGPLHNISSPATRASWPLCFARPYIYIYMYYVYIYRSWESKTKQSGWSLGWSMDSGFPILPGRGRQFVWSAGGLPGSICSMESLYSLLVKVAFLGVFLPVRCGETTFKSTGGRILATSSLAWVLLLWPEVFFFVICPVKLHVWRGGCLVWGIWLKNHKYDVPSAKLT